MHIRNKKSKQLQIQYIPFHQKMHKLQLELKKAFYFLYDAVCFFLQPNVANK